MAVGVIHVSGTQAGGGGGGGGGGDIEAGPGIIVDAGDPTYVSADFGSGVGKVLEATKAAIGACLGGLTGILRVAEGTLSAAGLSKAEIEAALGPLATGVVRSTAGVLSSSPLTKAEIEATLGLVWAGDLAGSSNASQQVSALTYPTWITVTSGLQFGAGPWPALGGLKFPSGVKMLSCRMGLTDTTILEVSGSNTIILADNHAGVSSTQVRTGASGTTGFFVGGVSSFNINTQLNFAVNNVFWTQTLTAPTLLVAARTSDAACAPVKIQGQAPWASATGTNRNPGDVVLEALSPTNGGTTRGRIAIRNDGTDILQIDKDTSGGNRMRVPHGTIYYGRNAADTADRPVLSWGVSNRWTLGDSGEAGMSGIMQCGSSGNISMFIGATLVFSFNSSVASLSLPTWRFTEFTSPLLTHAAKTVDGACTPFEIASQAPFATATGSNRTPGDVKITIPSPTNGGQTRGRFVVNNDGTDIFAIDKDTSAKTRMRINGFRTVTSGLTAGGAQAMPSPLFYLIVQIDGTDLAIPCCNPNLS